MSVCPCVSICVVCLCLVCVPVPSGRLVPSGSGGQLHPGLAITGGWLLRGPRPRLHIRYDSREGAMRWIWGGGGVCYHSGDSSQ